MRAAARGAAAALLLAPLGGCALGPNYRRPELPAPAAYRDVPEEQASIADLPWFEVFRDDALQALVREALASNRDLLQAAARVEQSRDLAAIARSQLFPQVGYEVDASRGRNTALGSPSTFKIPTGNAYLAVLNATWELDLWGRIRRSSEAARAQMLASEAFRRGVLLSLVTDVAQAYFELRELDLELEIARGTVESFQETYDIFRRQFEGGIASRLDPLRGEAALADAAASVPATEQQIIAKENQISVLLGRPPDPIPRGSSLTAQAMPPEVPAGVPSLLLERRPDLIEAEENLVAANAEIGAALAEFFPSIGLTSLYGSVSSDLSSLLTSGTGAWALAASAAGPIFTFGQTWYNWKGSKAAAQAEVFQYQQVVLTALEEVSNALTARDKAAARRAELERQVEALRESVRISRVRYLGGLATYVEVLDAQQQLFPAELALAQTQRDQLLAVVALYRALGGGWSEYAGPPSVPLPLAP
jgi:multidrug efflux system outer membrane protein